MNKPTSQSDAELDKAIRKTMITGWLKSQVDRSSTSEHPITKLEVEDKVVAEVMVLLKQQTDAAVKDALENLHDCRIQVAEKHVGMQMIPDIYATNKIASLTTQPAVKEDEE